MIRTSLCAVLCVLLVVPLSAQADREALSDAKRDLLGGKEQVVHRGGKKCLAMNNVASMELLLEVLAEVNPRGLPAAHYRDIVWHYAVQFTEPYARALVEETLKRRRASAWVRMWCAEALGSWADPTYGPTLSKALKDKDLGVRRAAARALAECDYPLASKELFKAVEDKDPRLRAAAIEALMRTKEEGREQVFLDALADEDGGVRCALLGALPTVLPARTEELSTAAVRDLDWRVRLQAGENLVAARTKTAIDAVLPLLDDERLAVSLRVQRRLQELTSMLWTDRRQWEQWWEKNREAFVFPPLDEDEEDEKDAEDDEGDEPGEPPLAATQALYNGLPIESDHVAFLIDTSLSMAQGRSTDGRSKRDVAADELATTLERLPPETLFNVYLYADEVQRWRKEPVPVDKRNNQRAVAFLKKAKSKGNKNIWQALESVLDDPTIDTVFLLSSGEPEVGLYVHHNRVVDHMQVRNRHRKVVVHSVAYTDSEWCQDQLRFIALGTGGRFVVVD